jgi:hypothetical protein
MTGEVRWDRVAAALTAAGVPDVHVEARRYPGGVSRSIGIGVGATVEVRDCWWHKNDQIWIGYRVVAVDHEGIAIRSWSLTKKRSEVVTNVLAALPLAGLGPH